MGGGPGPYPAPGPAPAVGPAPSPASGFPPATGAVPPAPGSAPAAGPGPSPVASPATAVEAGAPLGAALQTEAASPPGMAVPPAAAPPEASPEAPSAGPAPAPGLAPGPAHLPGSAPLPGPAPDPALVPGPAPAPAPGLAPAPGPALPGPALPGPGPGAGPGAGPGQEQGVDPWRRYDPWAAAAGGGAGGPGAGVLQVGGGAHGDGEAERRRQARTRLVGAALALALVSGVLGGVVGARLERNGGLNPVRLPQASAEPTGRPADSVAGIAARALPGVVTLHVSGSDDSGTGTGFVLDGLGYILTNNHVVEPAGGDGRISVVFSGGQTVPAEVVGRDSGYDLAVVRVSGVKGLKPLALGNSDNVRVGDPVVAIGAPFDLEGTVTSGIISARERPITAGGRSGDGSDVSYVDALQTDAPINPGNSGGPLLDTQGRVIGINSAIRSAEDGTDSGTSGAGSIGLGFAIPINQGRRVAEELINTGKATHPVIGVTLDLDYAGDGARVGTQDGTADSPVTAGGPADRAGIRAGDVITQVDGRPVHSGEELIVRTRAHRPGDRLSLTVERGGRARTLTLVLGSSGGD
ncbi:S1C family serine protease [Streptomyces asoensis]|uniref:S1C family serine protease n=1 Tax=Streptomyces asoensis TaxID=249586 RepID=UPI00369E17A2